MTWLGNYKNKECKTWIGGFFQRLVFNWYYKIITAVVLVLISAIAFNFIKEGRLWNNFFSILYGIGIISLISIVGITVIYAWIINPIRELFKHKKNK